MNTKKEYSPIRMTLLLAAIMVILASSVYLISKTKYGSLFIGALGLDNNPEESQVAPAGPENVFK